MWQINCVLCTCSLKKSVEINISWCLPGVGWLTEPVALLMVLFIYKWSDGDFYDCYLCIIYGQFLWVFIFFFQFVHKQLYCCIFLLLQNSQSSFQQYVNGAKTFHHRFFFFLSFLLTFTWAVTFFTCYHIFFST